MNFNDLLPKDVDPEDVLVMRHAPPQPRLREILPKLAVEKPRVFNAYQQTQSLREEKMLLDAEYLASFIGDKPGEALFIGLYRRRDSRPVSREEFWSIPENRELGTYGMKGMTETSRPSCLWFDLKEEKEFSHWKCKLVIRWGQPGHSERAWARWGSDNDFAIVRGGPEAIFDLGSTEEDEQGNPVIENLTVIREHKRVERDPKISAKVKKLLGYRCQACGFRFDEVYSGIKDSSYIEAHHLIPAWTMKGKEVVRGDLRADFAVLCANCHRMIHRFERPGDLAAFRRTIRNR